MPRWLLKNDSDPTSRARGNADAWVRPEQQSRGLVAGGWLSGGLDRATLVVAGVATLGLIMAVLDTTIVKVALDTLSRELHSPLSSIQ